MGKNTYKVRLKRGWSVVKSSLMVVRSAKALLLVPLMGFVITSVLLVSLFVFGLRIEITGTWDSFSIYPKYDLFSLLACFVYYYLAMIVFVFTEGVIAHNVIARFNGTSVTVLHSFKAAWAKKGQLAAFALVSSVVVYVIAFVFEKLPLVNKFFVWIAELSWAGASLFAIPIIMAHADKKVTPKQALKESSLTLKKLWQEGVSSQLSIRAFLFVAIVAIYALVSVIMRVVYILSGHTNGINAAVGVMSFVVVIACSIAVALLFNLLGLIARCALLYYKMTDKEPEQYDLSIMKAGMTVTKAKKLFS